MPTIVIDNMPASLFDQIQHLAKTRQRSPADTVLEVLETAFRTVAPTFSKAPLPREPFLTEEISPPFSIPRPEGNPTIAVRVAAPLPASHDLPQVE